MICVKMIRLASGGSGGNDIVRLLSVQCYAWTEYKFTCVCLWVQQIEDDTGSTPTTPGGSHMTASLGGRYDPWPVKRSTD